MVFLSQVLIFLVLGMMSDFFFFFGIRHFCNLNPVVPAPFVEKTILSPFNCLSVLVKNQLTDPFCVNVLPTTILLVKILL